MGEDHQQSKKEWVGTISCLQASDLEKTGSSRLFRPLNVQGKSSNWIYEILDF